jgi:F-type H+-transporting ATPase subunit a
MFFSLAAVQVGEYLSWNVAGLAIHGQVLIFTFFVMVLVLTVLTVSKGFPSLVDVILSGKNSNQSGAVSIAPKLYLFTNRFTIFITGLKGLLEKPSEETIKNREAKSLRSTKKFLVELIQQAGRDAASIAISNIIYLNYINSFNVPLTSTDLVDASTRRRCWSNIVSLPMNEALSREDKLLTKICQNNFLFWRLEGGQFLKIFNYLQIGRIYAKWVLPEVSDPTRNKDKRSEKRAKKLLGIRQWPAIPSRLQMAREGIFEYIASIAEAQLGDAGSARWLPFLGTTFIFIFVSNWLGAFFPWKLIHLPEGELTAPTSDINVTVALSLLACISYLFAGLRAKGLGFFARYVSPVPGFLPINILEDFAKPLSLSFRLFGNVLADEIVVSVLCLLVPLLLPLPAMLLGFFSGSVQALVFATLVGVYIWESID